jgi:glycosyltransferase involved in cell wall biosynthesis
MSKRINILLLIKGLGLGGAERMVVDALPYLDRERFSYEVAYLLPWKNFLVPQIRGAGITVHCLGMRNNYYLHQAVKRLHRLAEERRFDLIHAHLPLAGLAARFAGRSGRLPVVYTEHNVQDRYHLLTRWANQKTMHWNAHVISVSGEVTASLRRSGASGSVSITTVQNGVPVKLVKTEAVGLDRLREELGISTKNRIVGTVAVFRKQKRLDSWLEVAKKVLDRSRDVTFLLAGHGPEAASLREAVQKFGLERSVIMPGFRPDGRRLIGLLDVFLMTSAYEGLPIALLEAMALGKAIVATDVGGIPEAIGNGVEGFLAHTGDIELLSKHVCSLLENDTLRYEMGRRAAEKAEKDFDLKNRIHQVEDIYLEVLGKEHGRGKRFS